MGRFGRAGAAPRAYGFGMEYRHLGRTGLRVSPLCLGTMNFGPRTSEADSRTVMDAAHEHGVNFFVPRR